MNEKINGKTFYNSEIPNDWEVKELISLCEICYGKEQKNVVEKDGEYEIYGTGGVVGRANKFIYDKPSILIGRKGSINTPVLITKPFWAIDTTYYTKMKNGISIDWLYYKLFFIGLRRYNEASGVPSLSRENLYRIKFHVPKIPEQKAIAQLLSTWDDAITKTQSLIAKKEQRKKWLMQNLLTGKKRLKGFEKKKWKDVRLKDLFERITRKNSVGNTNVVTISAQRGFVRQTDFFNKTIASELLDNYFLVDNGEFCYNKSYSNGYPWGATKRLKDFDKAVVTTLYICFGIKDTNKTSGDFFEQFFEANLLDKGLMKIAHEGGRAHGLLNVTPSDFFELKIRVPNCDEQIAIAKVFRNADTEIQLIKNKLEKLKGQKKGLMQVLLTGKKRLKINSI